MRSQFSSALFTLSRCLHFISNLIYLFYGQNEYGNVENNKQQAWSMEIDHSGPVVSFKREEYTFYNIYIFYKAESITVKLFIALSID